MRDSAHTAWTEHAEGVLGFYAVCECGLGLDDERRDARIRCCAIPLGSECVACTPYNLLTTVSSDLDDLGSNAPARHTEDAAADSSVARVARYFQALARVGRIQRQ